MSPTVLRERGYRFFFFSREESRKHVHVVSADGEAKFWLIPTVALARNQDYNFRELREIQSIIEEHRNEFIRAWQQHFSC